METLTALEVSLGVVGALSGLAFVIGSFSFWIRRVLVARLVQLELPRLAASVKYRKFFMWRFGLVQGHEYVAAFELISLIRLVVLRGPVPDTTSAKTSDRIAAEFSILENQLDAYFSGHKGGLHDVFEPIFEGIRIASQGHDGSRNRGTSTSQSDSVIFVYRKLDEASAQLIAHIKKQFRIR
ncbi:MAG: hypothetical protein H6978_04415 [Gammaproteobacteria bacterium]|nr:hypothetical protein [Gammaproteobacteria bacterium]